MVTMGLRLAVKDGREKRAVRSWCVCVCMCVFFQQPRQLECGPCKSYTMKTSGLGATGCGGYGFCLLIGLLKSVYWSMPSGVFPEDKGMEHILRGVY